ncbi:hypothetical protein TNCV_866951 [Trichonephila clavipes]|nr:hypothetical protein TNCV_866951 [Trichonephila clavipes]
MSQKRLCVTYQRHGLSPCSKKLSTVNPQGPQIPGRPPEYRTKHRACDLRYSQQWSLPEGDEEENQLPSA